VQERKVPATHAEWVDWFQRNEEGFFKKMQTATQSRRARNRRLHAAADVPPAVHRMQPQVRKVQPKDLSPWQQLLWGRAGWHCAITEPSGLRTFFLFPWQERTYAFDISALRRGGKYVISSNDCLLMSQRVVPLEELDFGVVGKVREVFASAVASPGCVTLALERARDVLQPLKRKRRAPKRKRDGAGEAEDADPPTEEEDSDGEAMARLAADAGGSDGESSGFSVDTDADSGLDDLYVAGKVAEGDLALLIWTRSTTSRATAASWRRLVTGTSRRQRKLSSAPRAMLPGHGQCGRTYGFT